MSKQIGEARFSGKKYLFSDEGCKFPSNLFKKLFSPNGKSAVVCVGDLEELECESPKEPKFNAYKLVDSRRKPYVVATSRGECVMILSSDRVEDLSGEENIEDLKDAVDLHADFHGTEPEKIKILDIQAPDKLIFVGHLNYIVYSVPPYSERRGVPFIHEAKDRGDGVSKSKEKPIVCISPNKDFLVMYGPQFEFTERGIIG